MECWKAFGAFSKKNFPRNLYGITPFINLSMECSFLKFFYSSFFQITNPLSTLNVPFSKFHENCNDIRKLNTMLAIRRSWRHFFFFFFFENAQSCSPNFEFEFLKEEIEIISFWKWGKLDCEESLFHYLNLKTIGGKWSIQLWSRAVLCIRKMNE